jgi:hypothetical protein
MMKELKNSLITQKYTKIMEEENFKFNAPHLFKVIDVDEGTLLSTIKFQEGPIQEFGINGVCNEDLIAMVIRRLEGFQHSTYRCMENTRAIIKLEESLMWLRKRTLEREVRGVEGTHEI